MSSTARKRSRSATRPCRSEDRFSTADAPPLRFVVYADLEKPPEVTSVQTLVGADMAALARATADVVEEAVLDALFRAETMRGADDVEVAALDIDATMALLHARRQ